MRVLVIPASKYGGTAEIGRAMAVTLRSRGFDVDVSQPEHMFDLAPYGAHIIGSGLYLGSWLPQAERFVEQHGPELSRRPTWLFSSGPLGEARPETPVRPELLETLMEQTAAREHRLFSGRLDLQKLTKTERFIARWVGAKDDDYREWDEITRWTDGIADQLESGTGAADMRSAS